MQFKVGDFIRYTAIPSVVFKVTQSNLANVKFWERKTPHELWQVRPGEWVWHKLLNKLVQYKGPNSDEPTQHWFYCPDFSNQIYSITICSTLDCEPFIGTLPTYIKEH